MNFAGAAIVGAVEIPYSRRRDGGGTLQLLKAAFLRVLADAGVAHRDVDGLAVASFTLKPDHAIDLAWQLGLSPRWCLDDALGGASGIDMLRHAARAIQAGDANVVAVLAADHFEAGDFKDLVDNYNCTTRDFLTPMGVGGPNALFAMVTQSHMREYGLKREDYGAVCVAQREWARRNPHAVYRVPLKLNDYMASSFVVEPLCRFDCVPVVSGANALLLSASGDARSVGIRALAACYNHDHQEGEGWRTSLAEISPTLWRDAGCGPTDMDVVAVYDDYPVMALAQLADLGFVPNGDFSGFIRERLATRTLPVNTGGGQLSGGQAGAAGGLQGLVEVVTQVRGEAGERQITGARLGVASGYGMVQYRYGMCANAVVLEHPR
jgi:acetyl-CoA acetyltransferase